MSNITPSTTYYRPRAQEPMAMRLSRGTVRALTAIEHRTLVRVASVQAEGLVQGEKLRELDHLARQAMTGQALLRKWADTLAHGDPLLADELQLFTDLAKIGKGEIVAETVANFCREGRL